MDGYVCSLLCAFIISLMCYMFRLNDPSKLIHQVCVCVDVRAV
jgi:hypothetical protein